VDGIIQAVSGMMSVLGPDEAEAPAAGSDPVKVSFPVVDMTAGLLAAQGMLVALLARERHGIGQHVDVSLLEAALVMQKSSMTRYLESGKLPVRTGSRAPYATPNQAYRTKDGHIMVAAYTPDRWKAFCCNVLERPDIETDERFRTRQVRQLHHLELRHVIEDIFRHKTSQELLELCEENDLLCAPINTYREVVALEQIASRQAIGEIQLSNQRTMRTIAVAPRLSETPGSIRSGYPEFIGQHTREVLLALGLDDAEITRLAQSGAIGVHTQAPA
jgi:crotonobetainyl-CoA:carnitine CoA-transferase CaiB-like acyl-CoA transferase